MLVAKAVGTVRNSWPRWAGVFGGVSCILPAEDKRVRKALGAKGHELLGKAPSAASTSRGGLGGGSLGGFLLEMPAVSWKSLERS